MTILRKYAPTLMGPKMYVPRWLQRFDFWMLVLAGLAVFAGFVDLVLG